jgi:hypothetical protein
MIRRRPSRHVKEVVIGAAVVLALALVLTLRTDMPSGDFARAACRDLTGLVDPLPPEDRDVEATVTRATARAARAASLDRSFEALANDLRVLQETVGADRLSAREEAVGNAALGVTADLCDDLATPVESGGARLADLTVQDLRAMRKTQATEPEPMVGDRPHPGGLDGQGRAIT